MLVKSVKSRQILCLLIALLGNSVSAAPAAPTAPPASPQQLAYASIMDGITELSFEGSSVPGSFLLSGDRAFPLLTSSQGKPQMAASVYGSGRLVALCHESYLMTFPANLIVNAVNWLKGEGAAETETHVGVQEKVRGVADVLLSQNGIRVTVVQKFSSDQGFAVYVTDSYGQGDSETDLIAFMKSGGGLLMAGHAWHWAYSNPNENILLEYWGNKVSGVAGVYFNSDYGETATITVGPQVPPVKSFAMSDTFKADLDALLEDVPELEVNSGASISQILVHGRLAFPIAWDTAGYDREVYVAGGYYGKGRVIVTGHENYLGYNVKFWDNALRWLDQGRQGVVGVDPYHYKRAVEKTSFAVEVTEFKPGLSVFLCNTWRDSHLRDIQEFVAEGGGLVVGGQSWTYVQRNSDNYLKECPGNKVLYPMGLSIVSSTISGGTRTIPDLSAAVKENHLRPLLDEFLEFVTESRELTKQEQTALANRTHQLFTYLQTANYQSYQYQQVVGKLAEALKDKTLPELSYDVATSDLREKLLLAVAAEVYKGSPNQEELVRVLLRDPPQLQTVQNQRIPVNVTTADSAEWLSTGLYLSPGMKTTITFPPEMVDKDWQVQIGCQSDHLDVKWDLKRAPVVYERFPVLSESVLVHNFWGGLLYLVAPDDVKVEGVEVTVQQAVLAPYYKSGETNADDWPEIREYPAPWAELEMDNLILSVPSAAIRKLEKENVVKVAELWNDVMRAVADLSAIPHKLPRKERMVFDVQISAGLMHSGYPIMGQTPKATQVTDLEEIAREGLWGPFHELGHNQQRWPTEFRPHTIEATCNLWSLYVQETVLGVNMSSYQGNELTDTYRTGITDKWVKEGRKLEDWNTWVALETYIQLMKKYTWDAFKTVFKAYQEMDEDDIPDDNPGKMNLYAITFSQAVNESITDFLKSWNWPITKETEEKLSSFPQWSEHSMAHYNL